MKEKEISDGFEAITIKGKSGQKATRHQRSKILYIHTF